MEKELSEKEKIFRERFEKSNDGQLYIDPGKLLILDCNDEVCRILGLSRSDIVWKKPSEFSPEFQPDGELSAKKEMKLFEKVLRVGQIRFEWVYYKKDNKKLISTEVTLTHIVVDGKEMVHACWRDLTCIKESMKIAKESEERMRFLFNKNPSMLFIVGKNSEIISLNEWGAMWLGYDSTSELIGQSVLKVFPERNHDNVLKQIKRCLDYPDKLMEWEIEKVKKNGEEIWVRERSRTIEDPVNKEHFLFIVCEDITEAKMAQKNLYKSKKIVEDILNFFPDAVFSINENRQVIAWNKKIEEITGRKSEDVIGKKEYSIYSSKKKKMLVDFVLDGYGGDNQYEIFSREGGILMAEAVHNGRNLWGIASPLFDEEGKISGAIEAIRDITELKAMEAQFLQSQKMDAIGHLAGGIAHDFNNILSVILGYSQILKMKCNFKEVEEINKAAQRAANLTQSLLSFARKESVELKPTDLNYFLRETEKMLRRLVTEDIEIILETSKEELISKIDISQMTQVLMNLTTNAKDAMPNGGKIKIKTKSTSLDSKIFRDQRLLGNYCVISFADTGFGISEEIREKIFNPFFTTKEVGKGTGLGLSSVYGITKQHKGHIEVESVVGVGSEFRIYLPTSKKTEVAERKEVEIINEGSETILLAEDDESVRKLNALFLRNFGYKVIEAENGEKAIRVFLEHTNEISLVISDVVMPKKNGKEVYETIKKFGKSDVKFLFISGYTQEILSARGMNGINIECLNKPVSPKDLLAKIREILDH